MPVHVTATWFPFIGFVLFCVFMSLFCLQRLTDGLNLKTYSNIRGPREWEDGSFEKIQARYSEIVDKKAGAEGADK